MNHQSVFKTVESRDKIRDAYNEILSRFPFGQSYVDTTYGKTFILTAGADGNPPILLLHGSCSNSAFWFQEMMALSQNHSVFAVDIIGEAGNSEERRPELTSDDYALWLGEVLNALWLQNAIIIGNSLGGWLALKYAVSFPERVSKLILIAASGLSQQNSAFLDKAISAQKENGTLTMDASVTGGAALPQEVLDFMNLILRGYNPIAEQLPVFTDEQLQRLTMPVLFIGGENDVMVDTKGAAQRLSRHLPNAEIRLLDNVGHMIMNAPEFIIPFLAKESPLTVINKNGFAIAVIDPGVRIGGTQDLLDLFVTALYECGSDRLIVYKETLGEDFFDLRTGVAGELLQKCSNYRMRFAVVGDFSEYTSKSLRDFIYESNKGRLVCFVNDLDSAVEVLSYTR